MIPVDWVVILLTLILFPLALILINRRRTTGTMLCWFLESDKSARAKLLKILGNFVECEGERYTVNPLRVRLVRYPMGWPSLFQQVVPCSMYQRGKASPVEWEVPGGPGASSEELGAILEPQWMKMLVKGTREGVVESRFNRMLPWLTLGMAGISLIMIFVLMTKIGALEMAITALESLLK